jgi:hypothetical protein
MQNVRLHADGVKAAAMRGYLLYGAKHVFEYP